MQFKTVLLGFLITVSSTGAFFWQEADKYDPEADPNDYGVDVSFPIHHEIKHNLNSKNPMRRLFAKRYQEHIDGCYNKYSFRECDSNERARLEMSLEQPATQHNYTEIGFKKMKAPDEIYLPLKEFFDNHKHEKKAEAWPRGNTYVNNWVSPTYMVNFEDRRFSEGLELKQQTWDRVKPIIEEWTGMQLEASSLYGVRIYENEAILATHVDRLPLVSSCIIQIDQDIDEPWPIEVIGHDGKAYNVTMKPGDMVLYESHTVLHGRPFPMKGRLYANVFVHFIPKGHEAFNAKEQRALKDGKPPPTPQMAVGGGILRTPGPKPHENVGHESDNHNERLQKHLEAHDRDNVKSLRGNLGLAGAEEGEIPPARADEGQTALHVAAAQGDMRTLEQILKDYVPGVSPNIIDAKDLNGWAPLHEAARWGRLDAVKFLVGSGADMNAKCNMGTALKIARQENRNLVADYLRAMHAVDEGADPANDAEDPMGEET